MLGGVLRMWCCSLSTAKAVPSAWMEVLWRLSLVYEGVVCTRQATLVCSGVKMGGRWEEHGYSCSLSTAKAVASE
jgi:hypothetical protein